MKQTAARGGVHTALMLQQKLSQTHLDEASDAVAKLVRSHKGLLLTDTTWRDAHQSLLATRVRTVDIARAAEATAAAEAEGAFSIEMWGGATFDVCMLA